MNLSIWEFFVLFLQLLCNLKLFLKTTLNLNRSHVAMSQNSKGRKDSQAPEGSRRGQPLGRPGALSSPFCPGHSDPNVGSGGGGRGARQGEQLLRGRGNGCPALGKLRRLLLLSWESKEHVGRTWDTGPAPRRARGPCPCPAHSFSPRPPASGPHPGCQLHSPSLVLSLGGHCPLQGGIFPGQNAQGVLLAFRGQDRCRKSRITWEDMFPYPHGPHPVTPVSHTRSHSLAFTRAVLSAKRDFPLCQLGPLACTEKELGLSLPAGGSH